VTFTDVIIYSFASGIHNTTWNTGHMCNSCGAMVVNNRTLAGGNIYSYEYFSTFYFKKKSVTITGTSGKISFGKK
jgi:hypothetical protein